MCGLPAGLGLALSLFTSRFASAFLVNVPGADPRLPLLAGVAALLRVTSLAAMLKALLDELQRARK